MGSRIPTVLSQQFSVIPGVALCMTLAMAVVFASPFWGVPALILALFLGYVVGEPVSGHPFQQGIEFSRQGVLKLGVVLLAARLEPGQVLDLGWVPLLLVVLAVSLTLLAAWVLGRCLRLPTEYWLIGGAAVAICGASAAMAVAAILAGRAATTRTLPYIVASVTVIGSLAMIAYPLMVDLLGLGVRSAGLLIGLSIHDVAQVAGAGYAVSDPVGDVAIYTKMLRVAALVPVIALIALWQGSQGGQDNGFPGFLYAFAAVVVLNALGLLNDQIRLMAAIFSEFFLVTAMVGLGAKIQFSSLLGESWRPFFMLTCLSLLLLLFSFVAISLVGTA